jgi:hypothetical protein
MNRHEDQRLQWLLFLAMALALFGLVTGLLIAASAHNSEDEITQGPAPPNTETRVFTVSVDGKPAGEYHMRITRQGDGGFTMSGQARIRVRFLLYTYQYSYTGTEVYDGGRLSRLTSTTNDDGKHFEVTAAAQGDGLHVTANGQERVASADVWTTSYWRLPPGASGGRAVHLLDADTGKRFAGRLTHLEETRLDLAGQRRPCAHYRVTGPPAPVDLWYDGQQRLLRQEYLEDGHRTVLELKRLQYARPAPPLTSRRRSGPGRGAAAPAPRAPGAG